MSPSPGNIVLVGFMGAGKSEVGRHLAERTGRSYIDTDELVEAEGTKIADIFASEGERGFRERERRAVQRAARARRAVIATGGGAVLDPANVKALRRTGVVVYLRVGTDELLSRLERSGSRPLLRSAEGGATDGARLRKRIESLLSERTPIYESVADHVVACEGLGAAQTTEAIVRRLTPSGDPRPKVRSVRVALRPAYSVRVGRGLLQSINDLLRFPRGTEHVCVVSHPRIRRLWGGALEEGLAGKELAGWFTFPAGEERKTVETAARLARFLAAAGFHRSDVVLALGGGVVGDVSGYVASTYARGIPYVQLPTTLLAMVDASIGGKTGVNLPQGKNLVGTFHQPLAVLADLDVLGTLPDRELRAGLAEVVKTAFISDPSLNAYVLDRRDEIFARGDCLEAIVVRCARAKAKVVAADERETGLRMILNYGHTLGHALEAASRRARGDPRPMHHGEAVSVGMVFAAEVAAALGRAPGGLVDEHRRVLDALGLPTRAPGVEWDDVRTYMTVDKKYKRGMRMVLLSAPGKPVVAQVAEDVLRRAYERVSE